MHSMMTMTMMMMTMMMIYTQYSMVVVCHIFGDPRAHGVLGWFLRVSMVLVGLGDLRSLEVSEGLGNIKIFLAGSQVVWVF